MRKRSCLSRLRYAVLLTAGVLWLWLPSVPAGAAVVDMFWAGFNISDPGVTGPERERVERLLYDKFATRFRSARSGAVPAMLGRIKWDELNYFESAAARKVLHENQLDLVGVYLSIDKVLAFEPDVVTVAGKRQQRFYTYVFGALNFFAADSRNVVYSHPFFLIDEANQRSPLAAVLEGTLGKLADQLADANNPYTKRLSQGLTDFFGGPGIAKEALRRISGESAATYGVMAVCPDGCVEVQDRSKMTRVDKAKLGDFARFFLNARLAEYKQVSAVPEQRGKIQTGTGDVASTAKEGDITRSFSETCVPDYDDTGRSQICVKVLPPQSPIWIGVRSLVSSRTSEARLTTLTFLTAFDLEAEIGKAKKSYQSSLEGKYEIPVDAGQKVSDVYYVNALVKILATQLSAKTIP